jgi:DNA helicase IV
VHQEYFSAKRGFMLPEIVSQMEKAQDRIIRAAHKNPLVISGPAGSGKTTLALHRVAYLLQAPLTTDLYLNSHITVFVQDQRSKEYFSHLLPELGITTVTIQTYNEWALKTLGLEDIQTVASLDNDYVYEQHKIQALRDAVKNGLPNFSKSVFSMLSKIYILDAFSKQKELQVLDRIDLTLLLLIYTNNRKRKNVLEYNLIVVDEFQNYLPEQLSLLKSCINPDTRSTIYVGDIAQQINPGALREWSSIGEMIPEDRQVLLKKVYRNTRCILDYINTLGYEVSIPEGIKPGTPVKHISLSDIEIPKDGTIGILGITEKDLGAVRKQIEANDNVHIMTVREAQGLEFDTVVLIGFDTESYFEQYKKVPEHLQNEKQKIDRDLLYIGLTRAMKELSIVTI